MPTIVMMNNTWLIMVSEVCDGSDNDCDNQHREGVQSSLQIRMAMDKEIRIPVPMLVPNH